ncbi:hypothetical protein GOP47_0001548 [Adiantum capillus-veneris]|uniref:F-box/LRR-repeat protein 15-like leucin rich repeat domain-containing protein n=1 Tax=Adiantum capillus-veneris TaxID=13818 RepID=A0A9D4ZQT7_ADICA|nr:hypothetical protein GOP47_0001548 [Adiantum capillus-veneris]
MVCRHGDWQEGGSVLMLTTKEQSGVENAIYELAFGQVCIIFLRSCSLSPSVSFLCDARDPCSQVATVGSWEQRHTYGVEYCSSPETNVLVNLFNQESPWKFVHLTTLNQTGRTCQQNFWFTSCWRDAMNLYILKLSFKWCHQNISNLVRSVAPKFSKLQACQLWNSGPYVKDEAVKALAYYCHDLRDLDLSKGTLITDDSLFALAQGCRLLEKLNLSGCTRITEQGVIFLAEHCKCIKSLDLCGCKKAGTDQALLALAKNCMTLEELNLGWCETVTDIGVTGLVSWCSDLRRIDLCGCLEITDRSVIALADKCHHLSVLNLYNCFLITDAAMYALANSSKYRIHHTSQKRRCQDNISYLTERSNLSSISSSSHSSSSSGSIISNSRSCSNNEGSTLTSCDYLMSRPADGLEEFGLNSLNVGMCTLLSAQAVQAVCDAFPGLHTCAERHSLNISACVRLIPVHCACVTEARKQRR